MTPLLAVVGPDGRLEFDGLHKARLRRHLSGLIGKPVEVVIRQRRKKRSTDQNAYLHAEPFLKLAAKWGESVARTKLICMGEFWGWEPCRITGALLPVKAHTSDMTVEECTTFIDWLIPWGLTEHGVEILEPSGDWQEAQMEQEASWH